MVFCLNGSTSSFADHGGVKTNLDSGGLLVTDLGTSTLLPTSPQPAFLSRPTTLRDVWTCTDCEI